MAVQFDIKLVDAEVEIKIVGFIDEDTDFSSLNLPSSRSYILNLEGVNGINSMGLRNWLMWIRKLKSSVIVFKLCQPNLVDQMNILQGFLPAGAVVDSFYVPYFCSHCDREEHYLAKRGQDYTDTVAPNQPDVRVPAQMACIKCHRKMEMDIVPSKYFSFLGRRR